ncbi:MAG: carotenoid biosynthesis protein [Hyphomicrobium sp.]|nr:carotenoid biosynthesis protein [Hyphomicrobium sp.]
MACRRFLWLLVVLLALVELVAIARSNVALTSLHLTVMLTFAFVHGAMRYGGKGIAAFAVICLVVSNALENIGVATGFPFGAYHYTDVLGPKLGYVPLLIGPAYLGVGYLAWVLGTVLVADIKRGSDTLTTLATPAIGAFVMVLWDLTLDPAVSTFGQWWVWEGGGGFFGVPLSNYLGWYLTVFAFMLIFALYLRARAPEPSAPQPKSYYMQATAMYAVVALQFVVNYAVKGSEPLVDAAGVQWRSGDILEASAITALFTMLFVAVLAAVTIIRSPAAVH